MIPKHFLLLLSLLIGLICQANADETLGLHGDKALHGVINTITFPLEFPMQCYKGMKRGIEELNQSPPYSRAVGGEWGLVVNGTYHATGRAVLGINQLLGYWALNPKSNEEVGIPFNGEYSFDFDQPSTLTANQKCRLIGNKLKRGALNLTWGLVAELPLSVINSFKKRNSNLEFFFGKGLTLSLVKGSWYSSSRVWSGAFDLGGFLLPNHRETEGYAFEIEEPWNPNSKSNDEISYSFIQ